MKPSLAAYMTTTVPFGYKRNLLEAFTQPIIKDDEFDKVVLHNQDSLIETSHSLIFNFQNPDSRNETKPLRAGLDLRIQAFDKHINDGRIWMFDSDVLVAYSKHHQDPRETFVRIAYSKVYPNIARYFNENSPSDRWDSIAKIKDIQLKDYKTKSGDYIYICCNRGSAGYSGLGVNAADWAIETATELRKHTDRPIKIRQHKSSGYPQYMDDYQKLEKFANGEQKIEIHSPKFTFPDLLDQIKHCYAVCVFTSSAGAPAIIEGKPLFVSNETSYLYSMSSGNLNTIESPQIPRYREQWCYDLGYSHWSLNEIKNGDYWRKVKDQIMKEYNGQ
jgi:hypothetical protein